MGKISSIIVKRQVKRFLPFYLFTFLPLSLAAQPETVVRGDCMPDVTGTASVTRGGRQHMAAYYKNWDASKIYKQMVVLIEFKDSTFNRANAHDDYDRIFNEPGYNERDGAGCVADYFREQSNGLLNLQFDVYGPVKVDTAACPYKNPTANTRNYGVTQFTKATQKVLSENPDVDFSQYDWDGDGYVNQVIYVYASLSGNQGSQACYGFIWPNTGSFASIAAPGGVRISNYTSSAELWLGKTKPSCGIGTICHEFSHSLGLPDIYPTSSSAGYSVVDEWDLMDGGNFTNYGWCPPNYSPLEKMLLGWLSPIELKEPTTVKNLKCVADGGEVYMIKNTDNEYYLLENRQWKGWDAGVPGQGLVVYHVNYNASNWSSNSVNTSKSRYGYQLVPADNKDYDAWDKALGSTYPYARSPRMSNLHLSGSPYPLVENEVAVNTELTDDSTPAATVFNANAAGQKLMSKPVTNIVMSADGLVSFDFMGGNDTGITSSSYLSAPTSHLYTDLQGRRVTPDHPGIYIIRYKDGTTKKVFINP